MRSVKAPSPPTLRAVRLARTTATCQAHASAGVAGLNVARSPKAPTPSGSLSSAGRDKGRRSINGHHHGGSERCRARLGTPPRRPELTRSPRRHRQGGGRGSTCPTFSPSHRHASKRRPHGAQTHENPAPRGTRWVRTFQSLPHTRPRSTRWDALSDLANRAVERVLVQRTRQSATRSGSLRSIPAPVLDPTSMTSRGRATNATAVVPAGHP